MTITAHNTASKNGRVSAFVFTGNAPRKGKRIPLNEIKYNEQRDEETGYGYFGTRYMDHELMTMWLSVDPMMDKYPGISPLIATHKSALRFRDTQSLPECPQDILLLELVHTVLRIQ